MTQQYGMTLMPTSLLVLLIITGVLLIAVIVLYFLGKRLQKKQQKNEELLQSNRQQITMLVVDKKKMRLIDAGLPASVIENTPKIYRRSKMYIVKGKIGPKLMSFICDAKIFEQIPVKKEIKAGVSGLYILDVKGVRGALEKPAKKMSFSERLKARKAEKLKLQEEEKARQEKLAKKEATKQRQEANRQAVQEAMKQQTDEPEQENKPKRQMIRRGNNKKKRK